jgi:hypothetical protein
MPRPPPPAHLNLHHLLLRAHRSPLLLLLPIPTLHQHHHHQHHLPRRRHITQTPPKPPLSSGNTYTQPATNLSQTITPAEKLAYSRAKKKDVQQQQQKNADSSPPPPRPTPWMREGADQPPVKRVGRRDRAFAAGKLVTTPSRMLKLVIPLGEKKKKDRKGEGGQEEEEGQAEPLALLVHPHQPLSYLERLVQSELPMAVGEDGRERVPGVGFRAPDEDLQQDQQQQQQKPQQQQQEEEETEVKDNDDDGDGDATKGFVKWSSSTEIGDFIRDAARARHFALDIEGAARPILVAVPSFEDRTYYLRMRLRQRSLEIARMADIKKECDDVAERGARRVAVAGGAALVGYWVVVYMFTFRTELGWDVVGEF